jgi:exonuclease SbcC
MIQMKEFPPITPPIMKTNIITKNVDFRVCYNLWLMMDSIDQVGFDIEVFERDIEFDPTYLEQVHNAMMVLYATIGNAQKDEFVMNQENPFEFRQEKRPKIAKMFPTDLHMEPGIYELQDNRINQYYLDQIKKSNYSRFKTLKEAGITVQESVQIVFKQINNITNAVYQDYIQSTYDPTSANDLSQKIKVREDILNVYQTRRYARTVDEQGYRFVGTPQPAR